MKGKKQRQKVIPHCYRKNLSRSLSNNSISQLVQIGSYKKRINDLSRNNRHLAVALQDARLEASIQSNMLKDCTKDCNKILLARFKLNEMAKNLAKFVTDFEEVRNCLDVDFLSIKNPFTQKKGSPSEKVYKEPAINCIEEVAEDSSINETFATENATVPADPTTSHASEQRKSDDDALSRTSGNSGGFINEEDMDVAPILFTDDTEEKKKKSSSRSRSRASKISHDPDKGSLTPELNVDLTSMKLKRKSSRRLTQFTFPGSRSTSRGKNSSAGKENAPEELVTPLKPASPVSSQQEQDASKIKLSLEDIFKSSMSNNVKENLCKNQNSFPENHSKVAFDTNRFNFSNACTINPTKNVKTVASGVHPVESNHTVLLSEDMELTEIINPLHQIIVNAQPFANPGYDTKENGIFSSSGGKNDNLDNEKIATEKDSLKPLIPHQNPHNPPNDDNLQVPEINEEDEVQNVGRITFCEPNDGERVASKVTKSPVIRRSRQSKAVKYALEPLIPHQSTHNLPNDDNLQVPEINEEDEVQNVGRITFCEPNDDERVASKVTKSPIIRRSRQSKPVKYAMFFSSDESDEDSSFEINIKKIDVRKHKAIVSDKTGKRSEKNEDTVNHDKVSSESENKMIKNNHTKCTTDALCSDKEERMVKISKDKQVKDKDDSCKVSSKNAIAAPKDGNSKPSKNENIKKLVPSLENIQKSEHRHENPKNCMLSHGNDKKSKHGNDKKSKHENDRNSKHDNDKKSKHDNDKKSKHENDRNSKHDNDKKSKHNHEKVKNGTLSHENDKKLILSHGNDEKSEHNNECVKLSHHNSMKPSNFNLENTKKTEESHKNVKSLLVLSPDFSPSSILKRAQTDSQCSKKIGNETPKNKAVYNDDLNDSLFDVIRTPKSESRKVSFAPNDLVCNFEKMSVSKTIAQNRKVRRTSKSVLDFEELLEEKTKSSARSMDADNFSESTNIKKPDNPVLFNFSDDTELYTFQFPSSTNFSSVPTADDLRLKSIASSNASKKNSNKITKHSKKVVPTSRTVKTTEKLSLKSSKNSKNSQTQLISEEILEGGCSSIFESPILIPKSIKRKSLFKDDLNDSKENINTGYQIVEKTKKVLQEKDKIHTNVNSVVTAQNNCLKKSTGSKRQSKAHGGKSLKKLSEKQKLVDPTSDMKKKLTKPLENSSVLKDTINLPEMQDELAGPKLGSKRRSKEVCYAEPKLNKKLRRE